MQWFILKLSSPDAITAEYAVLSKQQQKDDFSPSGWQQIKELSQGKRVILLIPTEEVVLNQASIPASNPKQLAKAVPFALEENLAEDIESLHFVYHRESAEKDVNVSAINKRRLQHWLDQLQANGMSPHAILPDVFALPAKQSTATLSVHQQRALFRHGNLAGFSADISVLEALLPKIFEDTQTEKLWLGQPDGLDLAQELPSHLSVEKVNNLYRQCDVSLLQALPLNLLNRFQRKGQGGWRKSLTKWRNVAILIVLIGVLWTVITGLQNYRLNQQLQQLDNAIARVYSDTFPNARVDSDYRILHASMEEKLKSLNLGKDSGPTSPLELLAAITPTFKQHKEITLSTLRFDNSGLNLAVTAASLSKLEKFRAAVDTGAINAEVVSSTTSANKVESTIKIRKEKP